MGNTVIDLTDWANKYLSDIKYKSIINIHLFNSLSVENNNADLIFNIDNLNIENREKFNIEFLAYRNKTFSLYDVTNFNFLTFYLTKAGLEEFKKLKNESNYPKTIKIIFLHTKEVIITRKERKDFFKEFLNVAKTFKNIKCLYCDKQGIPLGEEIVEETDLVMTFLKNNEVEPFSMYIINVKNEERQYNQNYYYKSSQIINKVFNSDNSFKITMQDYLTIFDNLDIIANYLEVNDIKKIQVLNNMKFTAYGNYERLLFVSMYYLYIKTSRNLIYILDAETKKSYFEFLDMIILKRQPIGCTLNLLKEIMYNNNSKNITYKFGDSNEKLAFVDTEQMLEQIPIYSVKLNDLFYIRNLRGEQKIMETNLKYLFNNKNLDIVDLEEILLQNSDENIFTIINKNFTESKVSSNEEYYSLLKNYIEGKIDNTYRNIDILFLLTLFDIIETRRDGMETIPNTKEILNKIYDNFNNIFISKGIFFNKKNLFIIKDKKNNLYLTIVSPKIYSFLDKLSFGGNTNYINNKVDLLSLAVILNDQKFNNEISLIDISSDDLFNKDADKSLYVNLKNLFEEKETILEKFMDYGNTNNLTVDIAYKTTGMKALKQDSNNVNKAWYINKPMWFVIFYRNHNYIRKDDIRHLLYELTYQLIVYNREHIIERIYEIKNAHLLKNFKGVSLKAELSKSNIFINLGIEERM